MSLSTLSQVTLCSAIQAGDSYTVAVTWVRLTTGLPHLSLISQEEHFFRTSATTDTGVWPEHDSKVMRDLVIAYSNNTYRDCQGLGTKKPSYQIISESKGHIFYESIARVRNIIHRSHTLQEHRAKKSLYVCSKMQISEEIVT